MVSVGVWLATGAHPGWSMTEVPVTKVDEVTGIEYRENQRRFVAGVDFVAAGVGLTILTFILSFVAKPRTQPTP